MQGVEHSTLREKFMAFEAKTVKTVGATFRCSCTLLKQGVNEKRRILAFFHEATLAGDGSSDKGKVWGHSVPENGDFQSWRLELFWAGAKVRVEKVSAAGWPVNPAFLMQQDYEKHTCNGRGSRMFEGFQGG